MRTNKNGYVPMAVYMDKTIKEMREYVEYKKFLARTVMDTDVTKQFKKNTDNLKNGKYSFLYNNEKVNSFTIEGKKRGRTKQ